MHNKPPKKKGLAKLCPQRPEWGADEVRAIDLRFDQLFDGRCLQVLTILDAFKRLCTAIDLQQKYLGTDVAATVERVTAICAVPGIIRIEIGPEFVSMDLGYWPLIRDSKDVELF